MPVKDCEMSDTLEDLIEGWLNHDLLSGALVGGLDWGKHGIVKSQKRESRTRVHGIAESRKLGVEDCLELGANRRGRGRQLGAKVELDDGHHVGVECGGSTLKLENKTHNLGRDVLEVLKVLAGLTDDISDVGLESLLAGDTSACADIVLDKKIEGVDAHVHLDDVVEITAKNAQTLGIEVEGAREVGKGALREQGAESGRSEGLERGARDVAAVEESLLVLEPSASIADLEAIGGDLVNVILLLEVDSVIDQQAAQMSNLVIGNVQLHSLEDSQRLSESKDDGVLIALFNACGDIVDHPIDPLVPHRGAVCLEDG